MISLFDTVDELLLFTKFFALVDSLFEVLIRINLFPERVINAELLHFRVLEEKS